MNARTQTTISKSKLYSQTGLTLFLTSLLCILIVTRDHNSYFEIKGSNVTSDTSYYATLYGDNPVLNIVSGCTPKDINDFLTHIVGAKKRVQPEDCRIVNTSEAIFHWGNPDDKKAGTMWTLKIFDESGTTIFSKEVKSPRAIIYSDELAISKGVKYSWATSYVNKSGAVRQSDQRRFMISPSASNFSLPKGAYVAEVASEKTFPRRLPTGKTFDEIKTLSSAGDEKEIYNGMINLANYYKGKASPENPDTTPTYPTGAEIQSRLWYYKDAIDYLAYAYYFTKDESYLVSGKAKLLELAGIDPNGVSGELNDAKFKTSIGRSGDQLNRTAYLALASGFDLYYPYLSQEEKTAVISAYKTRILQAWPITTSLDVYSYDSHGLTVLGMLTQSLLHVVGAPEFEEGKAMLTEIFDIYKLEINMFGYEDGGFGNGVEYAWHNFYNLIPIVEDLYLITNINLANNQYLKNYGSYLMNFTLHTSDNNNFPFGDGGVIKNFYNDVHVYDYFRSYALLTGVSEYEWYWRQGDKSTQKLRNTRPLHLFMLGTGLVRLAGVAPSNGSTLFEDAGMFAAHSNIADKNRSTLYFKSSPFGSFNHSLAESNTFNFDSKGRSLLINSGYYSSYGDEHHNKVRRATKYKNSLTVNGGYGQGERVPLASYSGISNPIDSKDTTGKMINYLDNGDVVAITGDATLAYRYMASNGTLQPTLNSAIRSVVYIRSKGVVIVYDYADSSEEKKWELNFHSFEPFENNQGVIKVSNQGVNACMELYGLDYKYSSSDKFDIPQAQGLKDQYHARLEAVTPSKTLSSITVIKEGCNNVGVIVSAIGTAISIKLDEGRPIIFDHKMVSVPNSLEKVEEKKSEEATTTSQIPDVTSATTTLLATTTLTQIEKIQIATNSNSMQTIQITPAINIQNTLPADLKIKSELVETVNTPNANIMANTKRETNKAFSSERVLMVRSSPESFSVNLNMDDNNNVDLEMSGESETKSENVLYDSYIRIKEFIRSILTPSK